jgi:hypothetical protein
VGLGSGGDMVEWRQATVLETTRWGFEIGASSEAGWCTTVFLFFSLFLAPSPKQKQKQKLVNRVDARANH